MGKNYKRLCDVPECMEEAVRKIGTGKFPDMYCKKHFDEIINGQRRH